MVCTYEEYLKQPKAITFGKMQIFHAEMLAEIGADTEALELYDELMKLQLAMLQSGQIGYCLAVRRKASRTLAGLPATTP